jgi:hypothetical protein
MKLENIDFVEYGSIRDFFFAMAIDASMHEGFTKVEGYRGLLVVTYVSGDYVRLHCVEDKLDTGLYAFDISKGHLTKDADMHSTSTIHFAVINVAKNTIVDLLLNNGGLESK